MMDIIKSALGCIAGGKVLDVATQEGGFVQILIENLKSYTEIVGLDINEQAIEKAQSKIEKPGVRFLVMDAEQLEFEDQSFDTVSISASLHHLANIGQVLDEMKRVLKPGGHFILVEMHQDGQSEAELTSIYIHQWIAKVDTALGHLHNSTLSRQEFLDYVATLGLRKVEFFNFNDRDSDPLEKTRIERLEGVITRITQRAEAVSGYKELKERGEQLRQRLHQIGAQREPILIAIGEK
jgi:ubiquinone/menaquinone biosynthesis C-methylase UbiE